MEKEKNYKLLNRRQAAEFLSMSLSSFDTARKKEGFPQAVIILSTQQWMQGDLEQYIEDSKEVTK